ncbi:DUF6526 family protein [Algoriphagus hitonicola]|uniref:Uncharacterized protein n=1 Tax=Algoriphagus hitonicola TaxID=435880 RepID=A0A1I2R2T5_9BACT|nr:DUF6526 family protein [Algoriphagus hitonicola]SFG35045.1 hypothetical protein SAMN04487988_10353 [Algoriphagus hitonicola]
MKAQNFENHSRYYPFHHFVLTPLTLIYLGYTIYHINQHQYVSQAIQSLLLAVIIVLLPLLARIYALKNQNRIIVLEMRQRYFELTGKRFEDQEEKLRTGQIIALRFASDEELIPLMENAIQEKWDNKRIKKSIKNWKADYRRV